MIPNLSAGSIPVHSRVFGFEGLFVKVEVVMNSIEKGTRSTVKFSSIHEAVILLVLSEEFFHFYEDAFLSEGVSFFTVWSLERVVVVAISVDIVWIELFCSFREFQLEKSTTCRQWVKLT